MKIKTIVMTLAALAFAASNTLAANTNFAPANMSGSTPADEVKDRQTTQRAAPQTREPGFWDREAERSGLAGTGGGIGTKVRTFFHVPDWFKKQQDAYKQRHPEGDR